jgi:hypothetical protein
MPIIYANLFEIEMEGLKVYNIFYDELPIITNSSLLLCGTYLPVGMQAAAAGNGIGDEQAQKVKIGSPLKSRKKLLSLAWLPVPLLHKEGPG